MAVHMINRQPQTSWLEALAEKVVVPMISNALERQRQRDENRKNNALIAQIMKDITNQGQPQPSMPMGQSASGGNGWENASRASGISGLPQFDAGTADLLPPSMQGMQGMQTPQQTPQRSISANDFLQAMANNLGTPRFGMVDPKVAQELAAPYLANIEAARAESMRNAAVDKIWEAQDARGRRDATYEHVLRGNIPENLGKMMNDVYVQDRPTNSILNTGGQQRVIRVDPVTGETKEVAAFDNTLTPQEAATAAHNNAVLSETIRSNQANEAIKNRELTNQERPKLSSTTVLSDGRRIGTLTDGTEVELTPDTAGFTAIEKQQLDTLNTKRASLVTQRTDLLKALAKAQTDEERASIQKSISSIDLQIKSVDNAIDKMYGDKLNPTSWRTPKVPLGETPNVALNMLGGQGSISSPYNAPRKKKDGTPYNHMGIDIAAKGGTEILVPDAGGAPFTVTRIANDPDGYGNYADLETNYQGHKIEFRIGHMANGSLTVKKGDTLYTGNIIGLVGNTGNSRGENGGYHMHLEIKVDGKYINPEEFQGIIASLRPSTQSQAKDGRYINNPPQQTQVAQGNNVFGATPAGVQEMPQPQGQNGQAPLNHAGVPYVWYNPSTNAGYTQSQYDDLVRVAENRGVFGLHSREDVDNYIANTMGMQRVGNGAASQSTNTANTQLIPPLSGDITAPQSTAQDVADVLREAEQGMPQYDLSNAEFTASLPGSGVVPRGARRIDPDGGLTQYRAEGDNSPVTWRNTSGRPMRTSDGQLFTQKIYDEWRQKADAGHFRDVGISNAQDLEKWLDNIGMHPDRPSEQRGVNNLNGNSQDNANLPTEAEDNNITPFDITPSNSPEKFQAPEFTDEINGTTPDATQDLLDGLNGITDRRYRQWTEALKHYPSTSELIQSPFKLPSYTPPRTEPAPQQSYNDMYKQRAEILRRYPSAPEPTYTEPAPSQPAPQQPAPRQQTPVQPAPQRTAPRPKAGYTSYEQQRTHVDGAAKRHGVDSALIRAIIQTESGWNPNARSGVGAMGLMQLMPKTAKGLGVRNAYDPAQNIEGGTKYIAQLIRQFGGDVSKALMAYNCGAGNVKKGRIPAESKQYAQKVMSIYRRLKG